MSAEKNTRPMAGGAAATSLPAHAHQAEENKDEEGDRCRRKAVVFEWRTKRPGDLKIAVHEGEAATGGFKAEVIPGLQSPT